MLNRLFAYNIFLSPDKSFPSTDEENEWWDALDAQDCVIEMNFH